MLVAAYAQAGLAPNTEERFADALARLDVALARVEAGRELSFRSKLSESSSALQRFALSLARDPVMADDLVQDTLLRGWRSRASFTPGTNLEAWLFTILRNVFYTAHRRHSREVADIDGSYAGRLSSAPEQGGHLDLRDMCDALDRLTPAMREALLLRAVQNLSYEEAAAVMGCQVGTVKSRVWRAREQLARILGYTGAEIGQDGLTLSALNGPG